MLRTYSHCSNEHYHIMVGICSTPLSITYKVYKTLKDFLKMKVDI